ncbi:MAG: NYN domain-containing protein [Oceanococcaceae bacterium]
MSKYSDNRNLAVFCDFENIALGARDAHHTEFDITKVLERLLLKGSIVVKKAYCDWHRYAEFKRTMHEAAFELIDIPHVRQSGKNSADIRLVVDALDLCYTKAHVDTFVVVSGDSDFSPLVSKLRENNKTVIGVGVRSSTSDLLTANCDEFIFYDDLVESESKRRRRGNRRKKPVDDPRQELFDLVLETFEAVAAERDDGDKIWGSMIKQALKRRRPGFSESSYAFGSFSDVLQAMSEAKLLELTRDERSGGFLVTAVSAQ